MARRNFSRQKEPITLGGNGRPGDMLSQEDIMALTDFMVAMYILQEPVYVRPLRDAEGILIRCYQEGDSVEIKAMAGEGFIYALAEIGEYIGGADSYKKAVARVRRATGRMSSPQSGETDDQDPKPAKGGKRSS